MQGANSASPARPDGGQGRDLHPGIVSMPGSISILAATLPPIVVGSARTATLPNRPGTFSPKAHVLSLPCSLPCVGIGPNLDAGRAASFGALRNFSVRSRQFGDQGADGFVKWLPCVDRLHPARMEKKHGTITEDDYGKNYRRTNRV